MRNASRTLLAVVSLLLPALALAATNDFTANSNITVSAVTFGAGTADMLIVSGSTAESWTYSSGTFTVSNPGTFNVGSSDSAVKSIQFTSGGTALVCAENTTPGTSYATAPTAAGTYTVSPSAATDCTSLCSAAANAVTYNSFPTCGAASCSVGYRVAGSGGSATCAPLGGGVITPCNPGYTPSGGLCIPSASSALPGTANQGGISSGTVSATFTQTLERGAQGSDVYRLQQLLASDPSLFPEALITGYYGSLTVAAVGRFQLKYGVVASPNDPGYGIVGPRTRAKLQEVFGGSNAPAPSRQDTPSAGGATSGAAFSKNLSLGMTHGDVKKLQRLLTADLDTRVAESGGGSPGNETDYFGPRTEEAVQKFQVKHGIVSSATRETTGYG